MSLTSTLGVVAEDNYSTNDKISINLVTPIPTGFDDDSNFIPDAVGSYKLDYYAMDENGNKTTSNLVYTINISEVARPTISYIGSSILSGKPYKHVEAGIPIDLENESLMELIATDSKGVGITSPDIYVFKLNNYDSNKVGTYSVQYKVQDSYGRESLPFDYIINVSDTKGPTISGATELATPLNYGEKINLMDLTQLGLVLTDSFDPTPQLILHDDDGFNDDGKDPIGVYSLKFDAKDGSGNLTSSSGGGYYAYTIKVEDLTAPTIVGNTETTVEVGTLIDQTYIDNYIARGLSVSDNVDYTPSVTAKFVDSAGDSTVADSSVVGDILVNYDATDSKGNNYSDAPPIGVGEKYLYTIHVIDLSAPKIEGLTSQNIDFGLNSKSFHPLDPNDLGVRITDNSDERPQLIYAEGTDVYDGTKVGSYNMKYIAIDKYDNKSTIYTYKIDVVAEAPIINTNGNQAVNIAASVTNDWIKTPENVGISAIGEDGDFNGAGDDITSLITVKENGGFDSTAIGTYPITYKVIDPVSSKSTETTINIEVRSAIKPSFYGEKSAKIKEGDNFDVSTSKSTNLYIITDRAMTLEEAIANGIVKVDNYGTDNDTTTISDNFKGDGSDPEGTYLIEYTASYNGYDVVQKYSINVAPANKPHIIGKNKLIVNNGPIPYNNPKAMGMTGISTVFTDITKDITKPIIRDSSGNITALSESGHNIRGTYILEYNLHDPIENTDADPFYYTVHIAALDSPTFTYTPPEISADSEGMISYSYNKLQNSASEEWQLGYDANIDPETRLIATSADGKRDLPIDTLTTGGYNKDIAGIYEIKYSTTDPIINTTSTFNLEISVGDRLPPKFIGETVYENTYGTIFTIADLTLSTVDSVDGTFQAWSNTLEPDKMTIVSNMNIDDPTISFKGDGSDAPGTYKLEIQTEDRALNIASTTITINQGNMDPIYTGIPTEVIDAKDAVGFFYYLGQPASSSIVGYSGHPTYDNVAFTEANGTPIPFLVDYSSTPEANDRFGVFLYKTSDIINDYAQLRTSLNKDEVQKNTYCASVIYGEVKNTVCQDVRVSRSS